jgi:hypothetical protein
MALQQWVPPVAAAASAAIVGIVGILVTLRTGRQTRKHAERLAVWAWPSCLSAAVRGTCPMQPHRTSPPAGRASGPPTRDGPPAAGAPPQDPGDSGMPRPGPATRRTPEATRPRLPGPGRSDVGCSTWTRQARPGRAKLARRDAATGRRSLAMLSVGAALGLELEIPTSTDRCRPTPTHAATSTYSQTCMTIMGPGLLRDKVSC